MRGDIWVINWTATWWTTFIMHFWQCLFTLCANLPWAFQAFAKYYIVKEENMHCKYKVKLDLVWKWDGWRKSIMERLTLLYM